jgi:hypothetical protein
VRDARVFALAAQLAVPIAVAMAGGYGRQIETTVGVHLNTVREALALHERRNAEALA